MTRPVAHASWMATLVVLAGAVAAFTVSWLAATPEPAKVADAVLQAVSSTPDPGAAQTAVLPALPEGAAALIDLPRGVPEGGAYINSRVAVVHGAQPRLDQLAALAGRPGSPVIATAEDPGGTWVAVAMPPPAFRPFPVALAVALITALTGGAVAALLLLTGQRSPKPDGRLQLPTESADPQVPQLLDQRERLVRGLAELVGALPAEFEWRAARVLESAGVQRVLPDGQVFDPAVHHAVGSEPTPDSARADTVARTLQTGWVDRGRVLVPARVVVFVADVRPGVPP
jgi:hypothetical protein